MTEDEERDLLHQVDSLENDLTRVTSEAVKLQKEVDQLKIDLAASHEAIGKIAKMFGTLTSWIDFNRVNSHPSAKDAYQKFDELLVKLKNLLRR